MAAIISVSLFPRYKQVGLHLVPIVVGAMRRTLYDNMTVAMEEISAAEYARIVAPTKWPDESTPGKPLTR